MQQTKKNGGLIMMHAENGLAIDVIAADTFEAGTTDPIGHGLARHAVLEGEATNRVIRLPRPPTCPSTSSTFVARRGARGGQAARDEGLPAFAETCPQYLFLSLDDLRNGFNGAKFVCSPPLRTADHHPELWTAFKDDLQPVSTDHCLFDFEGQKDLGKGDFRKVPNGLPGVEDRMDLPRWRRRRREDHPRALGRDHRDGACKAVRDAPQEGAQSCFWSDADLVVYDPNRKYTISAKTHHMDVDYSLRGPDRPGQSDVVLSRGSVIVRDGEFTGRKGAGKFVKRGPPNLARIS